MTIAQRSVHMARIGSKDTKPEISVRRLLHRLGYRFRLHRRDLPGTPDLVFPSRRKVIFVHGCFWHHHPGCRLASIPKTRTDFWMKKFSRNRERDIEAIDQLSKLRWEVCVVWQCETRRPELLEARLISFLDARDVSHATSAHPATAIKDFKPPCEL